MTRFVAPLDNQFDINGNPLVGAKREFFVVGEVAQKDTFSDEALTVPNTNPVIANASGVFPDIFLKGDYDVTLRSSGDTLISGPDTIREFLTGGGVVAIQELTTVTMAANTAKTYVAGDLIDVEEYTAGKGGSGRWKAVDETTVIENGANIIPGTGAFTSISFVLIVESEVILSQFGITGDSDDSANFQIALDFATTNNRSVISDTDLIANNVDQTAGLAQRLVIKGVNNSKWTQLTGAATVDALLDTIQNFEISGVEFDGDKDSQTNRPRILRHTGDDLTVTHCIFRNSVTASIEVKSADNVDISSANKFFNMAEHNNVLGENSFAIHIDSSIDIARCHINDNFFINPTPVDTSLGAVAIALSTEDGKCGDTVIRGNYIENFGRRFAGNQEGCIEVYKNCDRLYIGYNIITKYHFSGIRVSDSQDIIVVDNIVVDEGSDIGAGQFAITVKSLTHDITAKFDFIVDGNIVKCATRGAMFIAGGSVGNELHNAIVSNNDLRLSGESSLHLSLTDGEILLNGNLFNDAGLHNLRIQDCSGTIIVNGGLMKDATNSGIFCRTGVTSLDLIVKGVTIDTSTVFGMTLRDLNSVVILNNDYIGATPSSADFDMSGVTSGRVEGNSWQKEKVTKTGTYSLVGGDIGRTFTNETSVASSAFNLPIVTSIPEGFQARFIILAAQQVDLNPDNVDRIFPTTNADGDRLRNAGNIGENVTLEFTHADGWSEVSKVGTWTDAN